MSLYREIAKYYHENKWSDLRGPLGGVYRVVVAPCYLTRVSLVRAIIIWYHESTWTDLQGLLCGWVPCCRRCLLRGARRSGRSPSPEPAHTFRQASFVGRCIQERGFGSVNVREKAIPRTCPHSLVLKSLRVQDMYSFGGPASERVAEKNHPQNGSVNNRGSLQSSEGWLSGHSFPGPRLESNHHEKTSPAEPRSHQCGELD